MAKSSEEFFGALDWSSCRVAHHPNRILLCGGVLSNGSEKPSTARSFFLNYLKEHNRSLHERIDLAEDLFEDPDNVFDDLLEFEQWLAAVTRLLVIFVESPGSIAELGAFTANSVTDPPLLAIVEDTYSRNPNSFIARGPLLKCKRLRKDSVLTYPWLENKQGRLAFDGELFEQPCAEIAEIIEREASRSAGEVTFDPARRTHSLSMIAELVRVLTVATETELLIGVKSFDSDFDRSSLRKGLSVLNKVGLVASQPWGENYYWMSMASMTVVNLAFRKGSMFKDTEKWMSFVSQSYREPLDKRRKSAFENFLRTRHPVMQLGC